MKALFQLLVIMSCQPVKITDDGHGNCANVKGGSMSSAMTTFTSRLQISMKGQRL